MGQEYGEIRDISNTKGTSENNWNQIGIRESIIFYPLIPWKANVVISLDFSEPIEHFLRFVTPTYSSTWGKRFSSYNSDKEYQHKLCRIQNIRKCSSYTCAFIWHTITFSFKLWSSSILQEEIKIKDWRQKTFKLTV